MNKDAVPIWILILLVISSHISEIINTTSLPFVSKEFGVSSNLIQLSSALYYLGFATGILLWGRLSDLYGRRPVIICGILIYSASSFLCSIILDIKIFYFLRLMQAIGISTASVIGQASARDSYSDEKLSDVFSSTTIGVAFVPFLGTFIGGYMLDLYGFRGNFIFMSAWSLFLLFSIILKFPETNVYASQNRSKNSKDNLNYIAILKSVFQNRSLISCAIIVGFFNGIWYGFNLEATFFFINKLSIKTSTYSRYAILFSFVFLIAGFTNKFLLKRNYPIVSIIKNGLLISLIAQILFIINVFITDFFILKNSQIALIIAFPMLIQLFAHGIVVPNILTIALKDYKKYAGTAGSIFGSAYYIIVSSVNLLISVIHNGSMHPVAILFVNLSMLSIALYYIAITFASSSQHIANSKNHY